jgi:tetratricopeptide (TPR) repeat protein
MGLVNDRWNLGWTAFTQKRFPDALRWQEETARLAEAAPGMLPEVLYDLAVIRNASGDVEGALAALKRAVALNPKLAEQARKDDDIAALRPRLGEVLVR